MALRVDVLCRRDPFAAADFRSLRTAAVAGGLGALGFRVRVLAPDPGGEPRQIAERLPGVALETVPATPPRRNPVRSFPSVNDPAVLLRVLADRPDVVLVQSSWMAAGALLLGAAGVPVVLDAATVEEDRVRAADPTAAELHDLRVIERVAARECEGILAGSASGREVLVRRHAAHEGRIEVVPHPAAPGRSPGARGGALVWWGDAGDVADRQACAALEKLVLPLLKRLRPGTGIRLAGTAAARVRPAPGVEVRSLPDSVGALLDGAAAVVLPAATGGAGQAMAVEALSRGVPVVGARVAFVGLEDLEGAGLVAVEDDDRLAPAAADLLDDAPALRALSDAGLRAVAARRNPDVILATLPAFLERATRAWIDPDRKLDALEVLKGRWPESAEDVAGFLSRRRRFPW